MTELTVSTACSGIESVGVACEGLGIRSLWFSEIEPFPCAVLAHHYPQVPNLGDMTRLPLYLALDEIEAPDIFVAGSPCQSFSISGLRKGLEDARGNLTLVYVRIANEIDDKRARDGKSAGVHVWENVPGVLSSKDNAFGHLLAGLAGEDDPLIPSGKKWSNAGCVFGPQRAAAWRVLDAQHFGVAQRRRRVFIVASARDGFDPAAVLFEFDGLRRDIAPRQEYREAEHTGRPKACAFDMLGFGQYGSGVTASTLKARDYKDATDLVLMPDGRVRRLTPTEYEVLQGFPNNWTDVPYRGKPAADGPRYKAIGNSKAVPVVRWIMRRIKREIEQGDQTL